MIKFLQCLGAFQLFRRSALMQSRLYNVETVGEDTDMTFQMLHYLKERLCYVLMLFSMLNLFQTGMSYTSNAKEMTATRRN